jgi:hypothetical protein
MDCARVAGRRHSDPRSKRVSGCTGANSAAGLDLLDFPTIPFYETGTSIYALRQASRRSWRIGQRRNVKVKFLHCAGDLPATHEQETPRLGWRQVLNKRLSRYGRRVAWRWRVNWSRRAVLENHADAVGEALGARFLVPTQSCGLPLSGFPLYCCGRRCNRDVLPRAPQAQDEAACRRT